MGVGRKKNWKTTSATVAACWHIIIIARIPIHRENADVGTALTTWALVRMKRLWMSTTKAEPLADRCGRICQGCA